VRHVRHAGEERNACRILVGRSQGITSTLRRPRRRGKENSTMDSQFFCVLNLKQVHLFESCFMNRKTERNHDWVSQ
jgi:hypothetical protein